MCTLVRDTVFSVFFFDYCMTDGADGVGVVGGKGPLFFLPPRVQVPMVEDILLSVNQARIFNHRNIPAPGRFLPLTVFLTAVCSEQ